ncbi:MAG: hypothetical protein QM527_15230 [Alphaproteobacteria bacterium]|nr:hypothetical protein [Alphaproteobacteria bacterium]
MPLAALMLAGCVAPLPLMAQSTTESEKSLSTVLVRESADTSPASKDRLLSTTTGIAKGQQALRDFPQTVTVLTEKLMVDRNMDDLRQVLKTVSGVTFLAG